MGSASEGGLPSAASRWQWFAIATQTMNARQALSRTAPLGRRQTQPASADVIRIDAAAAAAFQSIRHRQTPHAVLINRAKCLSSAPRHKQFKLSRLIHHIVNYDEYFHSNFIIIIICIIVQRVQYEQTNNAVRRK